MTTLKGYYKATLILFVNDIKVKYATLKKIFQIDFFISNQNLLFQRKKVV